MRTIELVTAAVNEPIVYAQVTGEQRNLGFTDVIGRITVECRTDTLHLRLINFGSTRDFVVPPTTDCRAVTTIAVDISLDLAAVEVVSNNITNTSTKTYSVDELTSVPMLLGQPDLLRGLSLQSGIATGQEGSSSLYVRGGTPDQTMLLIDDAPVYNVNHLGGFLSIINGDAVKTVSVYKTTPPLHYGNRLSGIVDIRLKDGGESWRGNIGIGLISSDVYVEGPIIANSTTVSAGARLGYLGLLNVGKRNREEEDLFDLRMRDAQVKVKHKFSKKSLLYLSAYHSHDENTIAENTANVFNPNVDIDREFSRLSTTYGNQTVSLRHFHEFSPRLQLTTVTYHTDYRSTFHEVTRNYFQDSLLSGQEEEVQSILIESGGFSKLTISNIEWEVELGVAASLKRSHPYQITIDQRPVSTGGPDRSSLLTAFIGVKRALGNRSDLELGVRLGTYANKGFRKLLPEYRARISHLVSPDWSVSLSGNRTHQDIHLLASARLGSSYDTYALSDSSLLPQAGWQIDAGVTGNLHKFGNLNVGIYHRWMNNIQFVSTSDFSAEAALLRLAAVPILGLGRSRGIELEYRNSFGKLSGNINYTYSRTTHQFDRLNNGEYFPFRYDRPHDLAVVVGLRLSDRCSIGGGFVLQSGIAVTSPVASVPDNPYYPSFNIVPAVNNVRFPTYHRLDLSITRSWKGKKANKNEIKVSIYNAYNRINATTFSSSAIRINDQDFRIINKKIGQFGFLPSLYYRHEFGHHE